MVVRISDKTQNYSKVTKLLVKPKVNEQEEVVKDEPETQNDDEQVSQVSEEETATTTTTETTTETTKQPFDLSSEANKGKITDVQFTYKKDGVKHVVKPKENVNVSTQDNLNMTYKLWFQDISAKTLKDCGGIIKYQLPEGFKIRNTI